MPFARKKKTVKRVHRAKTKSKSDASKSAARSWGSGAPMHDLALRAPLFQRESYRVKLFYYEFGINRTGTAGAITNYFFSCNGMFDPNITSTGHQPLGFDTMMQYYEQYCVMRSKCSVTFINNGAQSCRCGVALTPDTTSAVIGDNVENGLIKMEVVDSPAYNVGFGNGQRVKTVTQYCDLGSYFGRKTVREMLNDSNLQGTVAANPSEQAYFDVQTWGSHFTDNTSVNIDVLLEYDAVFWEPRKIAGQ